jgi:hypothetical protein
MIAAGSLAAMVPARAEDWLPITSEELQMTDVAAAPKASAIYLYRQVDRDDFSHWERVYVRIKILTDQGRAQGNVAIRFDKEHEVVRDIAARTILPDGSVVKFDGTLYDKPLIEGRGVHVMTKTFSLPEVQPGCIIEYRYERLTPLHYVIGSQWIVSADLYTRLAKFSLVPYRGYTLRTTSPAGLPLATVGPKFERGVYTMVTRDVPPFITEEYMPPADELKMRVDFVYLQDSIIDKDDATFWTRWGKRANGVAKRFMDQNRSMQAAVAQTLSAGDSPEQKLRKLYARTPLPPASASRLERKATLRLTPPNWSDIDSPLVAVFDVKVPGWARKAGSRALVPVGVFAGANRHVFEHATRKYAVYFPFPHQLEDDVSVDLPQGWTVSSVPAPGGVDIKIANSKWTAQSTPTGFHLKRDFSVETLLVKVQYYGQLQSFFQAVRQSGDEDAVVSLPAPTTMHATSTGASSTGL